MKKTATILFLLLFISFLHAQSIIYVNQNVPGGLQNGTSWADAFPDLQQALQVADEGDEIWVAAGVYKPSSANDRSVSFNLVSGARLYGGFNGTETNAQQRDPTT
ncbi:MAG: hypothetical protein SFV22_10685, partial [Saprospiraceae bacterium]|nr:hypothetical protein [Saprospiraceae bacterium]